MIAPDWRNLRPVAHRGLHDADNHIIENTASAVLAATDHGYNVEVDLQLSADGRAMVFHDAILDRLTRESGPLIEKDCAALQMIEFRQTGDRMMTVEDLLELVAGRATLFLEIKSPDGNVGPLERAIVEALKTYQGPLALMSFNPESIAKVGRINPDITRGIVAEGFYDAESRNILSAGERFYLRHMLHFWRSKPDFIAYNVRHLENLAPRIAHRLFNYPLLTWTVRTGDDLEKAKTYNATPIFESVLV